MKKILIVDDDMDILVLMQTMLRMYDYQVEVISHWENINKGISDFTPDLILLDISLGTADGRVICKELKGAETTRTIPVILFSANSELGKNYQEVSAEAFIAKPFELSHLLSTIKEHLN